MVLAGENQPDTAFLSRQWPYPTGTVAACLFIPFSLFHLVPTQSKVLILIDGKITLVCMYGETAYNGSARYRKLFFHWKKVPFNTVT